MTVTDQKAWGISQALLFAAEKSLIWKIAPLGRGFFIHNSRESSIVHLTHRLLYLFQALNIGIYIGFGRENRAMDSLNM